MKSYLEEIGVSQADPGTPMNQGAGFGIRFLARLIDVAYTYLLALVAGFGSGILVAVLAQMGRIDGDWQVLLGKMNVSFGTSLLAAFVYQAMAEGIGSMSLGKLICGLRVVQVDGRPCSLLGAFKRDLLYHIDALFFGLVGYNAMKDSSLQQRYGDNWAKTVVVKRAAFSPTPKVAAWKVVFGLLLATAVWLGIVCTDMLLDVV